MKPVPPIDPLDDLMMAALHGDLTPQERAQFDSRLSNDPAARAVYLEAQAMHDLLEKTHREAQPDAAFEQRMISGVRRKLQSEKDETALESVLVLWNGLRRLLKVPTFWAYGAICGLVALVALSVVISAGSQVKSVFTNISYPLAVNGVRSDEMNGFPVDAAKAKVDQPQNRNGYIAQLDKRELGYESQLRADPSNQNAAKRIEQIEAQKKDYALKTGYNVYAGHTIATAGALNLNGGNLKMEADGKTANTGGSADLLEAAIPLTTTTPQGGTVHGTPFSIPGTPGNWQQNAVPNSTAANVTIASSSAIEVTIVSGETVTADSVTLDSVGVTLAVDGLLNLGRSKDQLLVGAGTLDVASTGTIANGTIVAGSGMSS